MTKIEVIKKNNHIVRLVCDGHTGYGVSGEDIVCSAVSSIVQTAVLGLMQVAAINLKFKRNDGYLEFEIPQDIDENQRHDADVILMTMLCGIEDLKEQFSDFIELEVK